MKLKINEISKMTGISASGIRFYEESGIIHPKRSENGKYRVYDIHEVSVLCGCRWFRSCGFSLEDTLQLMKDSNLEEILAALEDHCSLVEQEIVRKQALIKLLRQRISEIPLAARQTGTCSIERNPVLLWMKLSKPFGKQNLGEYIPQIFGQEVMGPFVDSSLVFADLEIHPGQAPLEAEWGIAIEEEFARFLCFSPKEAVYYIPARKCVKAILEVNDDLTLSAGQLAPILEFIKANRFKIDGPAISQRLVNEKVEGENRRYDRLWIPVT